MIYSVALTEQLHLKALNYLVREGRQEFLCFALWHPSSGSVRTTALLHQLVVPESDEVRLHGNVSFMPEYFERALHLARSNRSGLALIHSHLGPGWQGMSFDDVEAENSHAPAVMGITGLPFVGLTMGTDGALSARFWPRLGRRKYNQQWCSTVRVVGERLDVTFHEKLMPRPRLREQLTRTVSAWGEAKQATLSRLRVGVVGVGSVGAIVAEGLARMGVQRVCLIDFDTVETINLDRLLHATVEDARASRAKVQTVAKGITKSATAAGFAVETSEYAVTEANGFRLALDCDVLFCCVDRPWGRAVLNHIAYAHLIPIVDGGLRIQSQPRGKGLKRADWRAHIATPGRPCLECLRQYDPGLVSVERDGFLDDPRYIEGLPEDHELKRNENVFGFSLSVASFEILQFLAMVIQPLGQSNQGSQHYHFTTAMLDSDWNAKCTPTCPFSEMIALGDNSGYDFTGKHALAERKRNERKSVEQRKMFLLQWIKYILGNSLSHFV